MFLDECNKVSTLHMSPGRTRDWENGMESGQEGGMKNVRRFVEWVISIVWIGRTDKSIHCDRKDSEWHNKIKKSIHAYESVRMVRIRTIVEAWKLNDKRHSMLLTMWISSVLTDSHVPVEIVHGCVNDSFEKFEMFRIHTILFYGQFFVSWSAGKRLIHFSRMVDNLWLSRTD